MVDRKVVGPLPSNPCNQWYKVQLVADYWLHFPGTGVRESTPMSLTRVMGSEQVCRPRQTEGTLEGSVAIACWRTCVMFVRGKWFCLLCPISTGIVEFAPEHYFFFYI